MQWQSEVCNSKGMCASSMDIGTLWALIYPCNIPHIQSRLVCNIVMYVIKRQMSASDIENVQKIAGLNIAIYIYDHTGSVGGQTVNS